MKKGGKAPYISPELFDSVIESQNGIHSKRDRAILFLTHYTGMRSKEVANLKVETVADVARREIRDTFRIHRDMTKGQRSREVFLTDKRAIQAVRDYLDERGWGQQGDVLFLSQKGSGFTPGSMQRLIAIAYGRGGVDGSSHSGRRSFATNLLDSGVDIFALKNLLGHVWINTTQTYLETSPLHLKSMVGMLR